MCLQETNYACQLSKHIVHSLIIVSKGYHGVRLVMHQAQCTTHKLTSYVIITDCTLFSRRGIIIHQSVAMCWKSSPWLFAMTKHLYEQWQKFVSCKHIVHYHVSYVRITYIRWLYPVTIHYQHFRPQKKATLIEEIQSITHNCRILLYQWVKWATLDKNASCMHGFMWTWFFRQLRTSSLEL